MRASARNMTVAGLVAFAAGCSGQTVDVAAVGEALRAQNGLSANGLSANGLSANGLTVNGLSANGLSANGLSANGLSANGLSANGLSANGAMTAVSQNYLFYFGLGTSIGDNADTTKRRGLNAVVREAAIANSVTQRLLADPTAVSWTTSDHVLHTSTWGEVRISVLTYLYKIAAAPYHTLHVRVCKTGVSSCPDGTQLFADVTLGGGTNSSGAIDGSMNLGLWPSWETKRSPKTRRTRRGTA